MDCLSCCYSFEKRQANKLHKLIEKKLKEHGDRYTQEYKLLILGSGECGKSTFIKQIRIIHGNGYTENEKTAFVNPIKNNLLKNLQASIEVAQSQSENFLDDLEVRESVEILKKVEHEDDITKDVVKAIDCLCANPIISDIVSSCFKYHLPDSTAYFLLKENRDRILGPSYSPSLDDIVRLRVPTSGIVEYYLDLNSVHFRLVDVGGQRSERRKWIHCLDNVTAIIFIMSLSEYDQVLAEDPTQNRILESLALFKAIANYQAFENTSIILFLNKMDLFEKKIPISPLNKTFHDYTGKNEVDEAKAFILKKFLEKNPYPNKTIYYHYTCATDTKNIQVVFEAVQDIIVRKNISQFNLL